MHIRVKGFWKMAVSCKSKVSWLDLQEMQYTVNVCLSKTDKIFVVVDKISVLQFFCADHNFKLFKCIPGVSGLG